VPAAAVIPAPIAYIKVVAVKKLVVEFRGSLCNSRAVETQLLPFTGFGGDGAYCGRGPVYQFSRSLPVPFTGLRGLGLETFTLKKLECSKQAFTLEYISME
jgi:hypothetical protein